MLAHVLDEEAGREVGADSQVRAVWHLAEVLHRVVQVAVGLVAAVLMKEVVECVVLQEDVAVVVVFAQALVLRFKFCLESPRYQIADDAARATKLLNVVILDQRAGLTLSHGEAHVAQTVFCYEAEG